jgi:hypothetical protein
MKPESRGICCIFRRSEIEIRDSRPLLETSSVLASFVLSSRSYFSKVVVEWISAKGLVVDVYILWTRSNARLVEVDRGNVTLVRTE